MKRTTTRTMLVGGLAGAALAIAVPLSASAHIHVDPSSAAAGSSSVLTFSIGHGCDGSPTTAVDVTIPDEVMSVKPVAHAGWTITTTTEAVKDGVVDANGDPVSERTSHVVYTADTPLPDSQLDLLSLQVAVPGDAEGETLAFPIEQSCEQGSTAWDQVAKKGEAEPEHPAPTLTVGAASADGHGTADTPEQADAAATADSDDVLARSLGIAGLVLGAVALIVAVAKGGGKRVAKEKK
ncbi:Uncharacterized protein YcnI [Paramicrobacterium humi]|uniref:Uncharacterized protein YcnI n=1 Tax=Paramicrobacterium humi TaxID=640635 RepID=A0A1H4MJR7_9MICO|nr:YcnI family protein [Microbacterium humi]SEB83014.1 Uncharacterized protein YcnI [Microbacterium humi]